LDRNELGALLVQAGLGTARDHALIALLALNGLRISEALGADIGDLDMDRGHRTLRIVRKGGKHVTIPLAPRTTRALDLYVGERTVGPIFVTADGRRMDRSAADRTVKRLARRAGIGKRISPHSLRHSFITAALDAGVALRDVQEAASHAEPRTTIRASIPSRHRPMRYDRGRQSLDRHATLRRRRLRRRRLPDDLTHARGAIPCTGTARPRRKCAGRARLERCHFGWVASAVEPAVQDALAEW
jgi:integrase